MTFQWQKSNKNDEFAQFVCLRFGSINSSAIVPLHWPILIIGRPVRMPVRATPNHKMKAPSYPFYDWASLYDWINKPWKLHDDVWKSCKFLNSFAVHSWSTLQFILTSFWLIVKIFSAFIFQQTMSLNDFPASSGFSLAWLLAFTKPFAWLVGLRPEE